MLPTYLTIIQGHRVQKQVQVPLMLLMTMLQVILVAYTFSYSNALHNYKAD